MEKPQGYDEAQAYGDYETLEPGGYKCVIKKVKDEKTQMGKEYLKLAIDIAEGEHKDFYANKFSRDTRDNPKWSGIWTVFVIGYEPNTTNPRFKGLITSVEESNENFKFDFDEQKLVGKKVGIVFREEEFVGQDGQVHTAVKPFYATSYNKAEEAKIPNKKTIVETTSTTSTSDFASIDDDDDLPF